jgi:CheY-like chemotaxis protein
MDALLSVAQDKRLLVVEDEYLVADDMRRELEALGIEVVGPVPSVADALEMLEADDAIDGAILDVNLCGETVYPVAGALHARRVPFVFWSAYANPEAPADYDAVPRVQKPASATAVVRALLDGFARPVPEARPVLADAYMLADGGHLLVVRAGPDPHRDVDLAWVGTAFIDATEWSRRLRTDLVPGVPVRVPWRHVAGLRHTLAIIG